MLLFFLDVSKWTYLIYSNRLVWYRPWTLFTSIFCQMYQQKLYAVMGVCFMWMDMRSMEESWAFANRGDLVFFLAFIQFLSVAIASRFGVYAFLPIVGGAMSYYRSQANPLGEVKLFGLIPIPSGWYPWSQVALNYITGFGYLESLCGIIFGYAYLYSTEILPLAGGPRLQTPKWFRVFDKRTGPSASTPSTRFSGAGHRLGS